MSRYKLILLIIAILMAGFIATTLVSYQVSRLSIHNAIVDSTLPISSDNIYTELQKDLIRPIFISSMIASDTFLRDWLLSGEEDQAQISRYLREVRDRYGAYASYLVSDRTRNYYYGDGILKQVSPKEERDVWYYRVSKMQEPYEINTDKDLAHADALTIFVNYRVLGYQGEYLGVTGVGLTVDSVQKLISDYQQRFKRDVYLVDRSGVIRLSGSKQHKVGSNINQNPAMAAMFKQVLQQDASHDGNLQYEDADTQQLINIRHIPELQWYLFVAQDEQAALNDIRHALQINLLVSLIVTAIVVGLTHIALRRYQDKLETMATTDTLTGLSNRRAFDVVINVFLNENERARSTLAFIVLDVDHFKSINDKLGHLGGDHVLSVVARVIKANTRAADFVCRWGGEEFLIVIKDCDEHNAVLLAEKIRQALEQESIIYKNEQIKLTASLGVAVARAGDKLEPVMERADAAMYGAKKAGRNQVNLGSI